MLLTFPIKGEFRFELSDTGGIWTALIYQVRDQKLNQVTATDRDRHRAMGLAVSELRKMLSDQQLQEQDTQPSTRRSTSS